VNGREYAGKIHDRHLSLTCLHAHAERRDGAEDRAERPEARAAGGSSVPLVDAFQFTSAEVRLAGLEGGFPLAGFVLARGREAPPQALALEHRAVGFALRFAGALLIHRTDAALADGAEIEFLAKLTPAAHALRLAADPHALVLDQRAAGAASSLSAAVLARTAEVAGLLAAVLELHRLLAPALDACRLGAFADAVLLLQRAAVVAHPWSSAVGIALAFANRDRFAEHPAFLCAELGVALRAVEYRMHETLLAEPRTLLELLRGAQRAIRAPLGCGHPGGSENHQQNRDEDPIPSNHCRHGVQCSKTYKSPHYCLMIPT